MLIALQVMCICAHCIGGSGATKYTFFLDIISICKSNLWVILDSFYRPFGCGVILGGYDRDGPQLYMVEPSGISYVSWL